MTTWNKIPKLQVGAQQLEDMDGLGLEFMDGTDLYDMGWIGWTKVSKASSSFSKADKSSISWSKI